MNSKIEKDCFFLIFINTKLLERIYSTTGCSEAEENLETDNKLFTDPTWLWVIRKKCFVHKYNLERTLMLPNVKLYLFQGLRYGYYSHNDLFGGECGKIGHQDQANRALKWILQSELRKYFVLQQDYSDWRKSEQWN